MRPSDPLARRGGLAAGAALLLGTIVRPGTALAQPAGITTCCGNGPPDTNRFGFGLRTQLTTVGLGADLRFRFSNERTGSERKQWWWVFAVGASSSYTYFRLPAGAPTTTNTYAVSSPAGPATAYAMQSGFALELTWPVGATPIAYARPILE